jgi:hypothetical protein
LVARLAVNEEEINVLAVNSAASNLLEPLAHAQYSKTT